MRVCIRGVATSLHSLDHAMQVPGVAKASVPNVMRDCAVVGGAATNGGGNVILCLSLSLLFFVT